VEKASLAALPDVLDARDIAAVLGIGYVKALRLMKYGKMRYIRLGRVYRISKVNFIDWLHCNEPRVVPMD
jgi:excisionase family DNA binding protein